MTCSRRGYTLVELVVATGITVVLASILVGLTSSIMSSWNRSRGHLVSTNQAKLALDQLAADLEGAIFRTDGNVWLAATVLETNQSTASISNTTLRDDRNWIISGTGSSSIKPRTLGVGSDARGFVLDAPDIADCRFGLAGVWLRFFSTRIDDNTTQAKMSAPSALSYQLGRRRLAGTTSECVYLLFRAAVTPNNTFDTGYNLDPAAGNQYGVPNATDGDPGNVVRPSDVHAIANNVIDFGLRLYVREGSQLRLVFPARPSTAGGSPTVGTPSDSDTAVPAVELAHLARTPVSVNASDAYRNRFPDVAEIVIRVLSEEGATMIRNLEAGRMTGNWWDIALAHSTVYTRRVELKGRGL